MKQNEKTITLAEKRKRPQIIPEMKDVKINKHIVKDFCDDRLRVFLILDHLDDAD